MAFTLPKLPYSYHALEPYIDAKTMEVHHTKHHQTYIDNANQALNEIVGTDPSQITNRWDQLANCLAHTAQYTPFFKNNLGGHFNHLLFWPTLCPNGQNQPAGLLYEAIKRTFSDFQTFQAIFTQAALSHFGSGWAWLSISKVNQTLIITTTPNQDNPMMGSLPISEQGIPILALDLWEHAYYLAYQNKRVEYIKAFWEIIHWPTVQERLINQQPF